MRVARDDAEVAKRLPAGATCEAAVFTDHVKVAHVIRKILLGRLRS
jgi:hypothetical protein